MHACRDRHKKAGKGWFHHQDTKQDTLKRPCTALPRRESKREAFRGGEAQGNKRGQAAIEGGVDEEAEGVAPPAPQVPGIGEDR